MSFFIRPAGLFFVIVLFYLLKVRGFFTSEDGEFVTKVVVTVTIPATIFCSFADYERDPQLALVTLVLFGFALASLLLSFFLHARGGKDDRVFAMISTTGYNIGSFSLPIIRSFYGGAGVLTACMADLGNSVMINGGTYALTMTLLDPSRAGSIRRLLGDLARRMLRSPPILAFIAALPFLLFGWKMPGPVIAFLEPIASSNSFACMAMVGLSMGTHMRWADVRSVLPLLVQRILYGWVTCAAVYFLLPLSQEIREVLALVCVAPIPGLVVADTRRCGGSCERSGLLVSMSILAGMFEMTLLAGLFQAF